MTSLYSNEALSEWGHHLTFEWSRCYSIRMTNKAPESAPEKADVLQGTLDLMVLQTLASLGPLHGYAIAARLEQVSSGAVRLNMGTLYPGLMRLEQRGLVRAAWGVSENRRKARFYSITAAGRRQLSDEKAEWERMTSIMHALLHGEG
jgi:PadR family transcriptional regulator PadR